MAIAAPIRKKLLFIFINLGKIIYKYKTISEHKRLLKEFKDKPMIVTCEEAIKDEPEKDHKE
jgi:hypothetical protein